MKREVFMQLCVEQCNSISCSDLQSNIRKIIRKDYPDSSTQETFEHTQEELNKFSIDGQYFEYFSYPNQLGGYRWFFLCGKCHNKVNKLFLPPSQYEGYERLYLCKKCHHINNESVVRANNTLYKTVLKPQRKLRVIEKKLEVGHLRPEKIRELLDEYEALEREMRETPEYRLYLFKKKKNLNV